MTPIATPGTGWTANQGGAKAVNKDVYQESNGGKWVRYDANGHMIKGWDTNDTVPITLTLSPVP